MLSDRYPEVGGRRIECGHLLVDGSGELIVGSMREGEGATTLDVEYDALGWRW